MKKNTKIAITLSVNSTGYFTDGTKVGASESSPCARNGAGATLIFDVEWVSVR